MASPDDIAFCLPPGDDDEAEDATDEYCIAADLECADSHDDCCAGLECTYVHGNDAFCLPKGDGDEAKIAILS